MLAPVAPYEVLQAGDRLVFFGVADTIVDLQKIQGLVPAADRHYRCSSRERQRRRLYEVVVSPGSPLVGATVREANFRRRYDAVVIAIHRNGERIKRKIGDIKVKPGDALLLEGTEGFAHTWYNSSEFYLISELRQQITPHYEKAPLALIVMTVMIILFTLQPERIVVFAFGAACSMIIVGCSTPARAAASIDLSVLLVIAAALGIGAAHELDVSPRPFAIAVAIAASASFATPIGYQTNLIVYGPGGYHFKDFTRVGLPLNILIWLTAIVLIPLIWHF